MSFVEFVRAVSGDLLADALLRADVDLLTASDDLLGQRLKEYFACLLVIEHGKRRG